MTPTLVLSEQPTCEEASPWSITTYIPCGKPAVAVIDNGDRQPYNMCTACAEHNIRNRGARLVAMISVQRPA